MKRHLPGENAEHQAKRAARFKSIQKETREAEDEILPVISKPKPRRRTLRSRKDVFIVQAATSPGRASVDVKLSKKFEEEDNVYASNEENKTYSRKDSGDTCEQETALNVIDDQDKEIYSVIGKAETSESTTKKKNKISKQKDSFDIEHKKRRQWTSRRNVMEQIENDKFVNCESLNKISQNSSKKEIDVNKDAHYKTAEKLDTLVDEISKGCAIVIQNQSDLAGSKSFIRSEKVSTTNYSDVDVGAKYKLRETALYNQTDSLNKPNSLAFIAFEHSSNDLRVNSADFVRSEKIIEKSSEHSEVDENLFNNAEIIAQSEKIPRLETSTGKNKAFYQNGVENGKDNNNIELDLNTVVEEGHREFKNEILSPDSDKEVSVNNQIGMIYKEHVNSVAENRKPQNQGITQGDSDDIHVTGSSESHEKNSFIKCTDGVSAHFSSNRIPEISDEDRLAAKLAQELVQTYGGQDITPLEMLANQTVNQQELSFQTLNNMSSSYDTGTCPQYQTDNRDQENIASMYPSSNQYSQQVNQYGQTEGQQGGETNISQICDQPHLQYNLQDNGVTFEQQNCNSAPGLYQSSLGIVDGQYSEPYQSNNTSTPGDQWSNNQQQQPYRYQTADEIQQQLQQTYSLFGDMNGSDGHQSPQPFSTANFIPRPIRPVQMPDQNFGRTFFPSRGSCETSGNYYNHPSRYSNSPYSRTSTAHENYMAAQTISQMDYSTIYPSRDFIEKNAAGCFMSPPQIKQSSSSIDIHKRPSRISRRLQMGMPNSPLMGSPTLSDGLGDFTPLDHRASRSAERFGKQRYIVVNPSSIQHMHPKVLVGKYIDFLIMENEQLTEISKSLSVPKDIYVTEDMYFMDSLKSRNNFPSKKLIDWVCDFYPKLDVLSMQFKGMHPSGIPHPCYSADNGIDCRPTQQILEDTFYFFQREKMNRTNRH